MSIWAATIDSTYAIQLYSIKNSFTTRSRLTSFVYSDFKETQNILWPIDEIDLCAPYEWQHRSLFYQLSHQPIHFYLLSHKLKCPK